MDMNNGEYLSSEVILMHLPSGYTNSIPGIEQTHKQIETVKVRN